jgi:hypothetical protein
MLLAAIIVGWLVLIAHVGAKEAQRSGRDK